MFGKLQSFPLVTVSRNVEIGDDVVQATIRTKGSVFLSRNPSVANAVFQPVGTESQSLVAFRADPDTVRQFFDRRNSSATGAPCRILLASDTVLTVEKQRASALAFEGLHGKPAATVRDWGKGKAGFILGIFLPADGIQKQPLCQTPWLPIRIGAQDCSSNLQLVF